MWHFGEEHFSRHHCYRTGLEVGQRNGGGDDDDEEGHRGGVSGGQMDDLKMVARVHYSRHGDHHRLVED